MSKVTKEEIQNFVKAWSNQGHEVADKVTFWNAILRFLGVPQEQIDNHSFIQYEKSIKLKQNEHFTGSIDAYIPSTKVLIEQKSSGVDLSKPEDRPNGGHTEKIKPFDQARRYDNHLSANEHANYYVLCNFDQIVIYDIRKSVDAKPTTIELKDLERNLSSLDFLVDKNIIHISKQQQLSVDAGKLVSKMYDELLNIFSNYPSLDKEKVTHSINKLCVRLVFCLYAEDAGLFNSTTAFYDYFKDIEPNKIGMKLKELFRVLNTKKDNRNTKKDPFWKDEHPRLEAFPYVNGGLFADQDVIIPPFTAKLKDILLNQASRGFNWKDINPTIFGAVFESTLNPEARRQGGMHYTSVENIHKVIDPLFLDVLKGELNKIKHDKRPNVRKKKAKDFQEKLANLTFLDPACGSGNFLTETYIQLRTLENEALKIVYSDYTLDRLRSGTTLNKFYSEQTTSKSLNRTSTFRPKLDTNISQDVIKVSIQQFHGIEVNDFAVAVAKTALWIAESQMWEKTKNMFFADWDFLPLKTYTHIHEGNALAMDWNKVIESYGCHYIIGNPPFVGPQKLNKEQKEDRANIFKGVKRFGLLDYVSCWYAKAVDYMQGTHIQTAFVSTNSIVQGSQVPVLWQYLLNKGVQINFAYRSFPWESRLEVKDKNKAQVICVIIGFSLYKLNKPKYIFEGQNKYQVKNISPYLTDSSNIVVTARTNPISNVPKIMVGTSLKDNNYYVFTHDEMQDFLSKEPEAKPLFRKYYMGRDFLNSKPRYVLWFRHANPSQLRHMPLVMDRIRKVKEYRSNAGGRDTTRYKDEPLRPIFYRYYSTKHKHNALVIPIVTAPRDYIPMAIVDKDTICGGKLFLTETYDTYLFGILESKVHNDWVKATCTRLGQGLTYSNTIVYNNFPFPNATDKQKEKIEQTAQGILNARANHPNDSLADLYDPRGIMPSDLRKAHQANDKAVLKAYGLSSKATESEIVSHLFNLYEQLTKKHK